MARRSGRRNTEGVKNSRTEAEGGSEGEESDDDAPEEVSMKAGREAHEKQKQAEKSAREAVQAERSERKRRATQAMRERAEAKRQRRKEQEDLSAELLALAEAEEMAGEAGAGGGGVPAEHGGAAPAAARSRATHTRFKDKTRSKTVRKQGFKIVRGAASSDLAMLEAEAPAAARKFDQEAVVENSRRAKATLFASRRRATKPAYGFASL